MILLETTSDEYTTYDVTLPDILYEGQPHSIRVEFHTLYQIILVYIDDLSSPVMVLDPWIHLPICLLWIGPYSSQKPLYMLKLLIISSSLFK